MPVISIAPFAGSVNWTFILLVQNVRVETLSLAVK